MVIAGDPSGDELAAQLVRAFQGERRRKGLSTATFFGAGGPHLQAAGMELTLDLTQHAVIGLWEVIRRYWAFHKIFHELLELAMDRKPDLVLGVDYGGFNLRFAQALRERSGQVPGWTPKIVQFVSPQVWASRPGRTRSLEACHDLLLSILPFEPGWFAQHAPRLPVTYVGHPLVDRHAHALIRTPVSERELGVSAPDLFVSDTNVVTDSPSPVVSDQDIVPRILLLPGSRRGELKRHLPVVLQTARLVHRQHPEVKFSLVLSREEMFAWVNPQLVEYPEVEVRVGGLHEELSIATLAIASTGTVTLECAWYRVPTLALYKTSFLTYWVARQIITVPYLAMPNLLAGKVVIPEFIQHDAQPERLAQKACEWLEHPEELRGVREELDGVARQLGGPGAARRAACSLLDLLEPSQDPLDPGVSKRNDRSG